MHAAPRTYPPFLCDPARLTGLFGQPFTRPCYDTPCFDKARFPWPWAPKPACRPGLPGPGACCTCMRHAGGRCLAVGRGPSGPLPRGHGSGMQLHLRPCCAIGPLPVGQASASQQRVRAATAVLCWVPRPARSSASTPQPCMPARIPFCSAGQRSTELPKSFDPGASEERIYAWWVAWRLTEPPLGPGSCTMSRAPKPLSFLSLSPVLPVTGPALQPLAPALAQVGVGRPFPAGGDGRGRAAVCDGHAAAKRDGPASHGARHVCDAAGRDGPVPSPARPRRAVAARHRPRGHRHAGELARQGKKGGGVWLQRVPTGRISGEGA